MDATVIDERVRELDALADRVWGPGNWVTCPLCPDSRGNPSRHHVKIHRP